MNQTSPEKIAAIKQHLRQNGSVEGKSVEQIRQEQAATVARLPKLPGIVIEPVMIGHLSAEWVKAEAQSEGREGVVLYFHGGGFFSGSCDAYRDLAARISRASGFQVLVVDYRLAPEHRYPAANEDCLTAYHWLIENGISPDKIILGGDSVGGTLVLMTLLALRDAGDPLPAAGFLLSPHTDLLDLESDSYTNRAELDPMGSRSGTQMCVEYYLGSIAIKPAILSPLRQDLQGLPSLFLQVGDQEVLLSECSEFIERAQSAGIDATLEVWENMWHVFQSMAFMLPEGEQAIANIGKFIQAHLSD